MRRANADAGFVSVYLFETEKAKQQTNIIHFENADLQWLQFVTDCRKGIAHADFADIRIGPVADDNIYRSIRLFETGILDAEETIKRLKTEVLHDQWAFHTQKALSFLKFLEAKEIIVEAEE